MSKKELSIKIDYLSIVFDTLKAEFDQPGGGIQYKLPMSIDKLLEEGYIELIIK